jgi:hypothetical protein
LLCAFTAWAQASLRGTVTDLSGASVPHASVELSGRGGARHARIDPVGAYSFSLVASGKYSLQVTARGFTAARRDLMIDNPGSVLTRPVRPSTRIDCEAVSIARRTSQTVSPLPTANQPVTSA